MLKTLKPRKTSGIIRPTTITMGLDIGAHVAKVIVCRRRGGQCCVVRASSLRMPEQIQGAELLCRMLIPWLHEVSGTDRGPIIVSLPSAFADYEEIALRQDAQPGDAAWEAIEQLLGSESAKASYDWWLSGSASLESGAAGNRRSGGSHPHHSEAPHQGHGTTLHLVWMASQFTNELVSGLARGGLRCTAVDAPATALARVPLLCSPSASAQTTASTSMLAAIASGSVEASALASTGDDVCADSLPYSSLAAVNRGAFELRRNALVVDIGAGEVTFVWSCDGQAAYVRNRIRFAAESAAATVASALGVSLETAETLLENYGVAVADKPSVSSADGKVIARQTTGALQAWLDGLTFEIQRTLQYLLRRPSGESIDEVVICGGGACIRHLHEWLSVVTGTAVRPALAGGDTEHGARCEKRPLMMFGDQQWLAAQPASPLFAQALALARYGETL